MRKALLILEKDLRTELRAKDILTAMAYFSLLVLIVFNFAIDLRDVRIDAIAPGILWVCFAFAGVLGLNRTFVREQERNAIEGLMLCPIDRSTIYLGKFVGNVVFMLIVEALTVPIFLLLFNLTAVGWGLVPALLLGTVGFAALGTLFAALAVNTRTREVMLPVLLFPIIIPIVIAAVKATGFAIGTIAPDLAIPWLNLMMVFDLVFVVISYLIFGYVLEE
ncbi:MAG: heme exporter protein CcmB [Chloroflexota bacterium]|nr:heme exporter protein CcmB [Dehalococcoidia bacterium]MDW8253336.1 heme exporter protein CcmB [Chloroflexota bacterium]